MEPADFSRDTVDKLGRRAGFHCSNPDCGALTSGPQEGNIGAINIGEAAHIYGARPGSARYTVTLSSAARGDITNGIWLCRNCHKLVDSDPQRYTPELLFKWRIERESDIAERLGKPGEQIRQEVTTDRYREFLARSPLAYQIAIEKPQFWEYKLTIALLQEPIAAIRQEYDDLSKGLLPQDYSILKPEEFGLWSHAKLDELSAIIEALSKTINEQFSLAWGEVGQAGDEWEVLRACDFVIGACKSLLNWEKSVRSTKSASEFDAVLNHLSGLAGRLIERVEVIPVELAKPFEEGEPSGKCNIQVTIDLPKGFENKYVKLIKSAAKEYSENTNMGAVSDDNEVGCLTILFWAVLIPGVLIWLF